LALAFSLIFLPSCSGLLAVHVELVALKTSPQCLMVISTLFQTLQTQVIQLRPHYQFLFQAKARALAFHDFTYAHLLDQPSRQTLEGLLDDFFRSFWQELHF
jgi:hypothetical protein